MKKLMVMAVAVALAGAVQAHTVKWSYNVTSVLDVNGNSVKGTVFLYCDTSSSQSASYMPVTIVDDSETGGKNFDFTQVSAYNVGPNTFDGSAAGSGTGSPSQANIYTSYSLVFVDRVVEALDSITAQEEGWYVKVISGTVKGTGRSNDMTFTLNINEASVALDTYMGATAVPEPTSGLLLLVGGALLALRRRRA